MPMPDRKGWLAILFISFVLCIIPLSIAYYISTDFYNERYKKWNKKIEEVRLSYLSKVTAEQVLLLKDEKMVIDRTCLVFKNVNDKEIQLDLYLLDLDPEQSYPLCILKKNLKKEFWLGNTKYRVVSVDKRSLKLKILDRYQSP